jgi:hypothetical protein
MNAHIQKRGSMVPWWAAFGAPLLGVPILVALLAIGSSDATTKDADPPESGYAAEQVDVSSAEVAVELPPEEFGPHSRC